MTADIDGAVYFTFDDEGFVAANFTRDGDVLAEDRLGRG